MMHIEIIQHIMTSGDSYSHSTRIGNGYIFYNNPISADSNQGPSHFMRIWKGHALAINNYLFAIVIRYYNRICLGTFIRNIKLLTVSSSTDVEGIASMDLAHCKG